MKDWEGVGVPRGEVVLAEYQQSWRHAFKQEKQRLLEACGEKLTAVEHVGSTAIPGLVAKPLLDITVGLASAEDGEEVASCLLRLGYDYLGEHGIPGRFYFVLRQEGNSLTHVHMYEKGHHDLHDLIAFRNYLLRHSETARAYSDLKRELYAKYRYDRPSYTTAKEAFVQAVLAKVHQGAVT